MNWDHPNPHTLKVVVSDDHIDGLQHANNAVYVNWCEDVAWSHSASLGLNLEKYLELDRAMAITHSEFDYLQASYLGDELTVATWIVDWDKRLTMSRRFQIIRHSDEATVLRAAMNFACVEISSGKPRRLPKEFIEGYGPVILNA